MALFLVWHEEERAFDRELLVALERFPLRPGLLLVDSGLGLSALYHRLKWALPAGTALFVAPLTDAPKFKLMAPGALKWLRARKKSIPHDVGKTGRAK